MALDQPEAAAKSKPTPPVKSVLVKPVVSPKPAVTIDLDQEIAAIIDQSQLVFTDEQQKKRLANIIRTRLKGARNQIQARLALMTPREAGGVGLDQVKADKVLYLLGHRLEKIQDKIRAAVSQEPVGLVSQPVGQSTSGPVNQWASQPVIAAKPAVAEVKFKPQLLGPLDELKSLTLTDFRRLAETPQIAAHKILEKIKVLELDSFGQKIQGIKAWQQSQISRLYRAMGEQSLVEGKPITAVMAQNQAAGRSSLTAEEFSAIADLNQKLRRHN